jgi:hypothetical protein
MVHCKIFIHENPSMSPRHLLLPSFLGGWIVAASAWAGGTVQLEIVGADQSAAMAFQEWGRAFEKAGIQNVRLRSGNENERPRIETQGSAAAPVYLVTGVLDSSNELLLPGGRYRRGDLGRLASWLQDLAARGPNAGKEGKTPFGLSGAEFTAVRKDLTTPVGFATKGVPYGQAVEKIAAQLKMPLQINANVLRALGDEKIEDDLSDLTAGAALAILFRSAGYNFRPRIADGRPVYVAVPFDAKGEAWAAGWTSEQSDRPAVPALYEFRTVNISNVSAAKAIVAIAERVKLPVVFDRYALAKYKVDLETVMVSLPRGGKTTYSAALRKVLFQANLKFEVRYDEAGTPFLWITSLRPA